MIKLFWIVKSWKGKNQYLIILERGKFVCMEMLLFVLLKFLKGFKVISIQR